MKQKAIWEEKEEEKRYDDYEDKNYLLSLTSCQKKDHKAFNAFSFSAEHWYAQRKGRRDDQMSLN